MPGFKGESGIVGKPGHNGYSGDKVSGHSVNSFISLYYVNILLKKD